MNVPLSPLAYELLQRTRRAYVEAGPEGWCAGTPLIIEGGHERACVYMRMARAQNEMALVGYSIDRMMSVFDAHTELRQYGSRHLEALGFDTTWVTTNDRLGFEATVAAMDKVLEVARPIVGAPAPTREAVPA